MANLKKLVTSKVLDTLTHMAKDDHERYERFWVAFGRYIKQGLAIEQSDPEVLLRFRTTSHSDSWTSLEDYVQRMKNDQNAIYYILGDDEKSVLYSPHLDVVRRYDYEVLLLTDPLDAFMLPQITKYGECELVNVATTDLDLPDDESEKTEEDLSSRDEEFSGLIERFKLVLNDRVSDVRMTERLSDSPARLVDAEGAPSQEMQRVYRLVDKDFEAPKKILELNPRHAIIRRLKDMPRDEELMVVIIDQLYEDALLIEGLLPDPAGMIPRIQKLMEAVLE